MPAADTAAIGAAIIKSHDVDSWNDTFVDAMKVMNLEEK